MRRQFHAVPSATRKNTSVKYQFNTTASVHMHMHCFVSNLLAVAEVYTQFKPKSSSNAALNATRASLRRALSVDCCPLSALRDNAYKSLFVAIA
jgi:hypothetical protein